MTNYPEHMSKIEAAIIDKVITKALFNGYQIAVTDGEEKVLSRSIDINQIQKSTGHTEETWMWFYLDGVRLGFIWFVHGNEEDVISDCTDRPLIEELMV
jgi:hypothetical protein